MLKIQERLQQITESLLDNSDLAEPENVLVVLESTSGIKYNIWEDLVVLNYCQIKSDKSCQMVQECRSLVLELGTWEVVSRSFDRFFNVGETQAPEIDVTECTAYEKVDGSLIGIFNWKGRWLYRTRSMIMPDTVINGNLEGITWKDRIEEAMKVFNTNSLEDLKVLEDFTFICELTCRENRVVTKYACLDGLLTLLSIRVNSSGYYSHIANSVLAYELGFRSPRVYQFTTMEECMTAAKELRNLEEGFVLYKDGVPQAKCKNPAYVAAHRLRGEGCLTEKRVLDLIVMNETDEYLSIFPEDQESFDPYLKAKSHLDMALSSLRLVVPDFKGTQKEFAMIWKDTPIASIAFAMKSGKTLEDAWERLTDNAKHRMILSYK